MKRFEAKTLEAAYALATEAFGCSIIELDCEIAQHPTGGFLGIFAKPAIIVVARKQNQTVAKPPQADKKPEARPKAVQKPDLIVDKKVNSASETVTKSEVPTENERQQPKTAKVAAETMGKNTVAEETVLESFFNEGDNESTAEADEASDMPKSTVNLPLQEEIERELKALIEVSCFDIDVVEADVVDNTAYVFIDGEDAALLIGKEGYRYNALSYLISNWLHNKYNLYLKLEIAQFLASQQEMIRSYMEPVIEHVEQEGWGRTRALDGILVQIALEQLREEFPNKYVAIKRTRNGDRYVLINEFNKR